MTLAALTSINNSDDGDAAALMTLLNQIRDAMNGEMIDADIKATAAIAQSKLALTNREVLNLIIKRASASTVDIDADMLAIETLRHATINLTVDITTSGANGLDAGSEAGTTAYYVWAIHNSTTDTVAGLLSTSATSPTMPAGYDSKRLIGYCYNDASSNLVDFYQFNDDFFWGVQITELTNGSATSWTSVAHGYGVPSIAKIAFLGMRASSDGEANTSANIGWKTAVAFAFVGAVQTATAVSEDSNSVAMPNIDGNFYYLCGDADINLDVYARGFKFPL